MSLVKSFTHLKRRPKEELALPLLQRIASLVKPIMRKHDWSLPVLSEFFPDNESLVGLNINGGQKILLRLRPAWAPDTFYDDEQLVLVMLHELTHNIHGPHDSKFYAFLSKLEQEYEDLKQSGYSGEGFHSSGARLGVGVSHDLPPRLAKLKALEAAEKRRRTAAVLNSSGKLGGGMGARGKSSRELAAEAAERRARDEKSCGSEHRVEAEIEAQRAARQSVIDVIDVDALPTPSGSSKREPSPQVIVLSGPPVQKSVGEPLQGIVNTAPPTSLREPVKPLAAIHPPPRSKPSLPTSSGGDWACTACTLFNSSLALQCSACLSTRPRNTEAGWTCLACGEEGMPHDFWTCRFCGQVKRES